jgi:hypothetical protein
MPKLQANDNSFLRSLDLLTVTEACSELQLAPSNLAYHIRLGRIAPTVITRTGKQLFSLRAVLRFKAERERRRSKKTFKPSIGEDAQPSP